METELQSVPIRNRYTVEPTDLFRLFLELSFLAVTVALVFGEVKQLSKGVFMIMIIYFMISYDWILIKINDIIKWLSFSEDGAREYFADPSNIVDSCNILAIAALGIAWITLYVLWLISAAVLHTPLPMFCLAVSMIAYGLSPLCSSLSPFTSLHPPPSPSSSTLCSHFLPPSPSLTSSLPLDS